jgi:hypothetical protein
MSDARPIVGMVALYDSPDALLRAAAAVRDAGYRRWDCHSPYPIHRLDAAMGLKPSPVPVICLAVGFLGAALAMLMQWWMNAVDYPIRIGGKPMFSWPAFVPITFELFVLFAALTIVACLIIFCRLWRWHSPLHDAALMAQLTCDRFAVVLDARDARFTADAARALLAGTDPANIQPLFAPEDDGAIL